MPVPTDWLKPLWHSVGSILQEPFNTNDYENEQILYSSLCDLLRGFSIHEPQRFGKQRPGAGQANNDFYLRPHHQFDAYYSDDGNDLFQWHDQ